MTIDDLIKKGYDLIYKGASAFPHSNDVMHIGLIGTIPFLAGKYGSEISYAIIKNVFCKDYKFLKNHSGKIGLGASAVAEILWQFAIEPKSRYDHPGGLSGDLRGVLDTTMGVGLGYLMSKIIKRK